MSVRKGIGPHVNEKLCSDSVITKRLFHIEVMKHRDTGGLKADPSEDMPRIFRVDRADDLRAKYRFLNQWFMASEINGVSHVACELGPSVALQPIRKNHVEVRLNGWSELHWLIQFGPFDVR